MNSRPATLTAPFHRMPFLPFVILGGMLVLATVSAAEPSWRLDKASYIPAKMGPVLVFPRPEAETPEWARYRKTYPGLVYRIPIAVQGGAWPFRHELLRAPEGMRVGAQPDVLDYGVIVWDQPVEGRHEIALKVTDQDLTEVSVSWTLHVTAEKTLFLSPEGDDANPGTLEQLKRSFAGWHLDDTDDATYAGYHVILRGGGYPWAGMASRNNNIQLHQRKPLVFWAYPGEQPVMDMSGGKFLCHIDLASRTMASGSGVRSHPACRNPEIEQDTVPSDPSMTPWTATPPPPMAVTTVMPAVSPALLATVASPIGTHDGPEDPEKSSMMRYSP